mmetsp:Transcript_42146/g.69458  ORF Transcript_42146/g.69458 Transcript_42146/m.69458 type:complete len:205 (+) Transcript_42146:1378-1992(+)
MFELCMHLLNHHNHNRAICHTFLVLSRHKIHICASQINITTIDASSDTAFKITQRPRKILLLHLCVGRVEHQFRLFILLFRHPIFMIEFPHQFNRELCRFRTRHKHAIGVLDILHRVQMTLPHLTGVITQIVAANFKAAVIGQQIMVFFAKFFPFSLKVFQTLFLLKHIGNVATVPIDTFLFGLQRVQFVTLGTTRLTRWWTIK